MKKLIALSLALVLTLSCVSALADAAYTHFFTGEDLAGNTDMNGFVSASPMTELNTVVLKDDGTYEYTKLLATMDENGEVVEIETEQAALRYEIRYVYVGTYTKDGDQVTLNVPEDCDFVEDWGVLSVMGYTSNSEGKASEGARVVNYEGTDYDPMDNFSSAVYKFDGHDTPVSITVNADGTFTYNAVASSDDD
ncbi:MAG: hypothetical protein IJ083_13945 [Clostridia bacterium]|nr:hypothetical protein [Clostridia bacterium]